MGDYPLSRREFAGLSTAGLAGGMLAWTALVEGQGAAEPWDPDRPRVVTGRPLRVQPVLMHTTYERRESASWRSWSKINNPPAAAEEAQRIANELASLVQGADFPIQLLPLAQVTSAEQARGVHQADCDVVLLYAATGSGDLLKACFPPKADKDVVIFVRHRSGPTYYWYEALSTRYLKTGAEREPAENVSRNHGGPTTRDVVVDDYGEVAWRLRALYGLKNFLGQRIVALGGAWGKYDPKAPAVAREKYGLKILEVSYDDLKRRFEKVRADGRAVTEAEKSTERYLAQPGTRLATQRQFVVNAFLLYRIFKDWIGEHAAPAFTIANCMSGILPIAATTPCLPLSWLNDEGLMAFCESDFVVIPAGILLHYVSGKPVFLHNSTFPHRGVVTCAHCSAPRRMDGKKYEPAAILTHYESDSGAAPKVEMTVGQQVTFVDPEYASGRWLGFTGIIRANPMLEICRTQQDVAIQGDWKRLLGEVRDSHWMMAYGNHLQEIGYAARKIGLRWVDLSESS